MRIAVVGTGYVGLVAGTCLAESGNDVTCVDVDERKIAGLRRGEIPSYEPGLEELLRRNASAGRLRFTSSLPEAVAPAQVVFIAVGTPEGETGDADLQDVLAAAESIGRAIRQYTVVVDKSTVPVGTADRVRDTIRGVTRVEFDVVSNPEFLKEGAALEDFLRPDRVVIGCESERARRVMGELYAPFVRTESPIFDMDMRSAELTKYAANAMLATRISFMNDIAALCEKVGADVEMGLLRAVEHTNARQKRCLLTKALKHYGDVADRTFAVWGLAFKPKTDDMREAPSVELIEGLLGKGARVQASDPVAYPTARRLFGNRVLYAPSCYDAAEGADGIFLVTEWSEFRRPDFERLRTIMKTPVLFDGRNAIDSKTAREEGFTYYGIGRP